MNVLSWDHEDTLSCCTSQDSADVRGVEHGSIGAYQDGKNND
jgi:hypothetical protein